MKRCIVLAKKGLGGTYPNPLVGSVIVHDGNIIGEGWHRKAGEPHAEVHAIQSVKNKALLKDVTLYVSLEPCSHFGKTPPCANLIIEHEIPNVVIGIEDPFAKVQGNGIKRLRDAGVKVTVGVREADCLELNKRFISFHKLKRPYIILKWAQTRNGFIAPVTRNAKAPVWITNPYSRQLVHKWRAQEQAILVGTQTVQDDNPSLTTRDWKGKNPKRLVIDRKDVLDKSLNIFDNQAETYSFTELNSNFDDLPQAICEYCHQNNLQSLIVEGGAKTLQSFIDCGLWDEARVFMGQSTFEDGITAPIIKGAIIEKLLIANDQLTIYNPTNS